MHAFHRHFLLQELIDFFLAIRDIYRIWHVHLIDPDSRLFRAFLMRREKLL